MGVVHPQGTAHAVQGLPMGEPAAIEDEVADPTTRVHEGSGDVCGEEDAEEQGRGGEEV